MFGKAFKIGTILGFRIEVSFTFLIIMAILALSSGVVWAVAAAVVIAVSVLTHELGHAVVARRLGVPIRGIELHILGGAAKMERMPKTARDEILIAIAGPAVSFVLGAAGVAAGMAMGVNIIGDAVMKFGYWNLVLGAFNLLPALPMDGGRVLRAALSARMGRYRATQLAATVAQVFAVLFVVVAVAAKLWMLILLALLLWFMASQERRMAHLWRYDDEAPPAEVMDQYGNVISQHQGPGAVYTIPNQPGAAPPGARAGGGQAPVRRVIRLPNGMVMVVEEYRW